MWTQDYPSVVFYGAIIAGLNVNRLEWTPMGGVLLSFA